MVSNKTDVGRVEQMLPGASQRMAKVLDVEKDDFGAALEQVKDEE